HLLASGRVDVVLESDVNILDIAALTVIVRGAGGDITTLGGKPIDLQATSAFGTNARLRVAVAPNRAGGTAGAHAGGTARRSGMGRNRLINFAQQRQIVV